MNLRNWNRLAVSTLGAALWVFVPACGEDAVSAGENDEADAEALRRACGNHRCDHRETCRSCPADCGPCTTPPPPSPAVDAGSDATSPPPPPPPPPGGALLFSSGWENRTELGCNLNALVDRDYFGSPASSATAFGDTPPFPALCTGSNGNPDAEIVAETGHAGVQTRMLRVRQSTQHENGTDFRVGQGLSTPQTDFYASWWVKYSPNWQWAGADHKVFITGAANSQDVYFNVRGHDDGSPGYVVIHVIPADTRFDATSSQMSVGVWHFCELHIVSGLHGKVEARVDGARVPFAAQNEGGHRILDVNTGTNTAYGKIDTTYNDGAFITAHMSPAAPWFSYYDDVRMGTGALF